MVSTTKTTGSSEAESRSVVEVGPERRIRKPSTCFGDPSGACEHMACVGVWSA